MSGAPCPYCGASPAPKPKAEPTTAIGKRRAELGMSLQRVGNIAGITKAQVWEIERKDGSANPTLKTMIGLAKALRWPLETLIAELASDGRSTGGVT